MSPSIDNAFGIHADALKLRAHRATLLAANLANADTPNYKARDIDFRLALERARGQASDSSVRLIRTHASHQTPASETVGSIDIQYRLPSQASLDGNTVDSDTERGEFTANALSYLVSLRFLNDRVNSLRRAIKGE